jgi:hypothetical protein
MRDNMDKQGGRDEANLDRSANQDRTNDRPAADREVPLDAHARADAKDTINKWLDGEVSESVARRADSRQVEFWAAVGAQAEQRRRMTTPAYMTEAIMSALPEKQADRATMTTTHGDARLSLTPVSAAVAAAGFTALGVLIGRVIGR